MKNKGLSSRKGRYYRDYTGLFDIINIILGICIIVCSVVLFFDIKNHEGMFGVIFTLSALMNFVLGIKRYKRNELGRAIIQLIVAISLMAIGIISLIAVYFR